MNDDSKLAAEALRHYYGCDTAPSEGSAGLAHDALAAALESDAKVILPKEALAVIEEARNSLASLAAPGQLAEALAAYDKAVA